MVPDLIQPGQFIQRLLVQFDKEKRVYVVWMIFKSQSEHYMAPKMIWMK